MNRLFDTLRSWLDKPRPADHGAALPGFEQRMDVLRLHAQQAARYEDDLLASFQDIEAQLAALKNEMEQAIAAGEDRNALEYVRLLVRLRPQRELIDNEIRAFHAVAFALIMKVNVLVAHLDEARAFARSSTLNPAATQYLDQMLSRLTRYFVMLERVSAARRRELPDRLAALTIQVLDNRKLDMELANYILQRRRALDSGAHEYLTE